MDSFESLTEGQNALLTRFADHLRASPHNLLSPRGLSELERRHFPEGVAFARTLPSVGRVLDVGSGGGLPGIVVAIARPDLKVHLLEATRKKTDFLAEVVMALGLAVTVHHGRAEELSVGELGRSFDAVCARAVAPLERLVPWCAPYLRPGGRLYAIKGERWAEELEAAAPALAAAHMIVRTTPASRALEAGAGDGPLVVVLERARSKPSGSGLRPSRTQKNAIGHVTKP
ncbi:MAG: 16S rRNA (guanine(527)-N(7))-methyltransferase RsmG [Actinomycetota bacterium]|nr:16S rRNA (guanine(527)-N(7))-methyltransferase RsmG [Actinomycetota bacterium]